MRWLFWMSSTASSHVLYCGSRPRFERLGSGVAAIASVRDRATRTEDAQTRDVHLGQRRLEDGDEVVVLELRVAVALRLEGAGRETVSLPNSQQQAAAQAWGERTDHLGIERKQQADDAHALLAQVVLDEVVRAWGRKWGEEQVSAAADGPKADGSEGRAPSILTKAIISSLSSLDGRLRSGEGRERQD